MNNCKVCNGINNRTQSKYCSVKCSNKAFYDKNQNYMINRSTKWNKENKVRRNKRDNKTCCATYRLIVDRCNNPNNKSYSIYGGKGVKCLLLKEEFLSIYKNNNLCASCGCILNDVNRNASNGKTIDRIDKNRNYELGNIQISCRSCNNKKDHIKLLSEQIEEIKKVYIKQSKEFGTIALAKRYKVSSTTIWEIINR